MWPSDAVCGHTVVLSGPRYFILFQKKQSNTKRGIFCGFVCRINYYIRLISTGLVNARPTFRSRSSVFDARPKAFYSVLCSVSVSLCVDTVHGLPAGQH